ncbi:MAG: TIGR04219 family outer membrane beta-barrel protein [Gammaproteobacteria bacterium]|nr:TIGR04219 family outer membrane beta-barrel protein [Gammaproteobacteria bacterium]
MMKKTFVSMVAVLALMTGTAQADFLGLYVGTGMWKHSPSGDFSSVNAGSSLIDLESSLGMSSDTEAYLYAAFEHPIPLVPNVRMESTALTHDGTSGTVSFNGATVSGASTISLDSMDTVLYWRILDNWINVDLGLTLRKFDGEFTVGSQTRAISESIPMAYAAAQFDLPFTGLSIGADYNHTGLDHNSLDDIRVRLLYEMGTIGFEGGIRNTSIKLSDVDGVNADMKFDGVFLGVFLHF